uniref:Uncharacterized protein n=1 Tax=Arundo donax TaxID=35708 RepID=A0A0A9QL22_ARUDO
MFSGNLARHVECHT